MNWTILVLIMWSNGLVAEDFGTFSTIEHCEEVSVEMVDKLKEAGADAVAVCLPSE
jgi:hypothetical protein